MNQLNHQRLRLAFQSLGYSDRDYLDKMALSDVLGRLANEDFDIEILQQLWEQCRLNSQGKTKIETFNDNVIRAEAILMQKQKQTSLAMQTVVNKLQREVNLQDKVSLQNQLQQLKQIQAGFAIDLQILRKPFLKFSMETVYHKETTSLAQAIVNGSDMPDSSAIIPISNKMNLTWITDLALLCLLADIFVTFYLNTFMNSVLFLLILSLCLFEYFDRTLIRFLFWSTIFTLLVDIVWYCIAARGVWSPNMVSNQAHFINGYLKFSVVVISFVFIIKILIAMLLCSQYNIDESQPQKIILFSKQFILSKQKQSPVRKALENILKMGVKGSVQASHVSK